MNIFYRKLFLLIPFTLVALFLTACNAASAPDAESNEPLLILEWTGYEATEYPEYFLPFTEKYGETINDVLEYSFFGDDSEALARMQAGVEADLVHPCRSWWGLYVDQGLVQPIDTSRLTNWDGVPDELKELGQFNGEQYFIPWDWGYESILVRNDLVQDVPDSWSDLWDPQYEGRVSMIDASDVAFIIGSLSLGFDPWNTTPEQNEAVKQQLIALRPNLLNYWVDYTETYDLPASGDAWVVAGAWQDAYGYLTDEGYDVSYIDPVEGRIGWMCGYAIGSKAKNIDRTYEFLNAALDPQSQANMANDFWYGVSNFDAIPMIDEKVIELLNVSDFDSFFNETVFYQPLTEEQRQQFSAIWNEVKASQ
ncbi:MAG: ABC transporter substrate-binding protein [Anaerolineae bacterium]|nr:ABC transporter substrate-binding protein [Anaerolineae bacterium]